MQLVLDDQVGRQQPATGHGGALRRVARAVEAVLWSSSRSTRPKNAPTWPVHGMRRELVDRGDHEARQPAVDRLVDRQDRQRLLAAEVATPVHADDAQVGRLVRVRQQLERERLELRRRTTGSLRAGSATACGRRSGTRSSRARAESRSLSPLRPIRFGVAARPTQRPISNGQSPRSLSASFCRSSSKAQIKRRRAAELVEREQPQRVAHQHAHARAGDAGVLQPRRTSVNAARPR